MKTRGWEYETYWMSERLIRHFVFDSLEDYLRYLEEAPVQEAFRAGCASELGSADFKETQSLQESVELARFGWHEGFTRLMSLTDRVKRALDYAPEIRQTFHDYVGFAPDVKAYMEGSPLSMINAPVVQKPHVDVYMNTSMDGLADPEEVYMRGAATLALCDVIEACGIMVDMHLFEMSFVDKEVLFVEVVAKARDERLNMMKLHFPLCHPSWIRRLNFRLIETMPNVTKEWAGTYGIPAERPLMEQVLDVEGGVALVPTMDELKKRRRERGVTSDSEAILDFARIISEEINPSLPVDKQLKFKSL